jgi:hypothetical protein
MILILVALSSYDIILSVTFRSAMINHCLNWSAGSDTFLTRFIDFSLLERKFPFCFFRLVTPRTTSKILNRIKGSVSTCRSFHRRVYHCWTECDRRHNIRILPWLYLLYLEWYFWQSYSIHASKDCYDKGIFSGIPVKHDLRRASPEVLSWPYVEVKIIGAMIHYHHLNSRRLRPKCVIMPRVISNDDIVHVRIV